MSVDAPRRRPQQARSEATVAAILGAAREVLEAGEELTARSIGSRAGLAAPTVYRYFSDISDVIDALVHEHALSAEAMVAEVLSADDGSDVERTFRAVVDGYLSLYAEQPELTTVWRSSAMAERQRAIEERSDDGLARRLADHLVAGGAIRSSDRREFTRRVVVHWQMAGVAIGALLRARTTRERSHARADLDAFVAHAARRCNPVN